MILSVFLCLLIPAQAQERGSAPQADNKDVMINEEVIKEEMPSYSYDLKQLIREAEKNIKKAEEKIKEKAEYKEKQQREVRAREHFEKGNTLYKEGKYKKAKKEWQQALDITKDPSMQDYIKTSEQKAREEEQARKAAEREALRKQREQERAKAKAEREKQRQLEKQKREEERARKAAEREALRKQRHK